MAAGSDAPLKRRNSFPFLPPTMSELRVVILGSSWSQRSSVGNLLLNEAVFDAMKEPESPIRQTGELQDKKISVINCPDLLQPVLTADAQSEFVRCIADVCDPGPHVFLLVLQPEDFTEQHNFRLQSVLRSFSEQAFQHSLVLLTATKETSVMEDYVHSPPLKDLIRKCKYRYQWMKSLETHLISEVHEEIFTKIVQILKENNEKHVTHDIFVDAPTAAHQTKERKGVILTAVKKGFNTFKMSRSGTDSDSALRIVLFGKSNNKKEKIFNFIHQKPNDNFASATQQTFIAPKIWKETPLVVKTPDLFCLSVETVTEEMKKCVSQCSPGPHVLLLLVKSSDFTENDRKTLTFVLSLFGPGAFKHSMVVLTHNIQTTPSVSQLISDCGGRFYNMFDENHKLLTHSLKSIVDQNKASFLTLTEEQKPSLNLVLFGKTGAEKTSVAESILRRAKLPAAILGQCVKHEEEVCGRRVSLVELPALSGKPLETVMEECLHCISLCPPEGVHVFILVLPLGPLTDEDKAELKTIQDTLSSRVRPLTMILFIHSEPTAPAVLQFVKGDRNIQELCQSCGVGYFIFNPRDQQQVPQLLDYLNSLKTKNETYSYTTETLQQAQIEKISAQHKEIDDMKRKMNKSGDSLSPDCLKIVLIGKTGNGKSSSGNTILGRKEFSAMSSQISVTKTCKRANDTVDGRSLAVVDTPGLFDTTMSHDEVFEEMLRCISLLAPGPHVFLLVLQIGRLTKEENDTLKLIKEAFGKEAQKFTVILFTHGDQLVNDEMSIQDYIEKHCESSFKELISECGNRYHVFNNSDKQNRTQVLELLQKINEMVKENGGGCYTNDMLKEADAAIKKEMKKIMKEKEEEMKKEREEMERKYQQEMEDTKQKMDKQKEEFEKERHQREKELRDKEEKIIEEKEQRKREQEKREEEERKRKEEEKLQRQEWEQKQKALEEKIRLEQQSKEQFEVKLQESRRQMEVERDQWEKERKEWWEKRKQEDEERRQQEKKLQEEMRQIANEKEQKEKELKAKEMKIKEEECERKREQKKREEEDRQRKEQEEKQHREWERKHKELEEKTKSEEQSKEMFEIKLQESTRQMEQEREQWERERNKRLDKRKQEDEERRQLEERRQEEMRQIKKEKELKEKELKEKEERYKEERKREQENREKEDIKRKEEEEQQRLEWEQKHKELEQKIQLEAKSKEIQLEENRRQMEQERAQWENERKEWWEKRKQEDEERKREDEERKREEEKRQKEIEQEMKNYNERIKEDERKLELEEKKRKKLEEKHKKKVKDLKRNYEEKARRQAEEHNEFKEKHRKDLEYLKQCHKEQLEEKDKSYDLLQALTALNERKMMEKHQNEISVLVKRLQAKPGKLIQMNNLISKHEKEINELVTKHEEEINKATNEEEKKAKQKEQEEERETKQKQHEKEIRDLVEEVKQSYCVIL